MIIDFLDSCLKNVDSSSGITLPVDVHFAWLVLYITYDIQIYKFDGIIFHD